MKEKTEKNRETLLEPCAAQEERIKMLESYQ